MKNVKAQKKSPFSVTAQVEIQGPRVFKFLALNDTQAEFQVIGLSDPKIRVVDTRPKIRETMQDILQTKKVETLAGYFNTPARVTILPTEDGEMVVRLDKTRAKNPRHMLWVAIGIGEDIPIYQYKKVEIQRMRDKNYALFSLYRRPQPVGEYS